MTSPAGLPPAPVRAPALAVTNPSGNRNRIMMDAFPFTIGRQGDNHLVLRDNRISRSHAQIAAEKSEYFVEDLDSRHGVYLNGQRVKRGKLSEGDRIDFGFPDSYRLVFTQEEDELNKFLGQISAAAQTGTSNLSKLRSLVEVARALQSSLSTSDVLAAVVDAALSVTGAERGFLLLGKDDQLEVSVARDRRGAPLDVSDLAVPRSLINRALRSRRDLLSMTFDSSASDVMQPDLSVAGLELRSVVCVPLIQVRTGSLQETVATSLNQTVGVLYMDSRQSAADLSSGNREILQTLALEASTILENARLLDEERAKQHMEEELNVARTIQTGLLPQELPAAGWFRASGSSIASRQVGGDYFDVRKITDDLFACVITDVSGKGVSAALLAALLQGAFVFASESALQIEDVMSRVNKFLYERAHGEKYATVVYCTVNRGGELRWSNAGHPKPLLVRPNCDPQPLESTGIPIGMMDIAMYDAKSVQLQPGDKIVLFSDGVSEAANAQGECFDKQRLKEVLRAHASASCAELHAKLLDAVKAFSDGDEEEDDITTLVLEYQP
jgi:serine phosphatase RsbU (regulator of sigma subunit)